MRKFRVTNVVADTEIIDGRDSWDNAVRDDYVGDYIEADNGDEAVELAMEFLADQIKDNDEVFSVDIYYRSEEILVRFKDGSKELYTKFTADLVSKNDYEEEYLVNEDSLDSNFMRRVM